MHSALDSIAEILTGNADAFACQWAAVRFQHTMAIRAYLLQHYKPATTNKMLSALRGVLKTAWLLGQLSAEDYHKAVTVPSVKNDSLPAGREVEKDEIAALITACQFDDSPTGIRDTALVAVLYSAGLRRAEIVQLRLADFKRDHLVIQGKGGKERIAWLNQRALDTLTRWIQLRGSWTGALFCPINKGKNIVQRPLTTQAIYYILQKRANEAEVAAFSPHDLRRTFVSDLLEAGADIATVSRMAGHANIQTTARYDRRSETAKKEAAELLDVPYNDE